MNLHMKHHNGYFTLTNKPCGFFKCLFGVDSIIIQSYEKECF